MVRRLAPNPESESISDEASQVSRARVLNRAIESAIVQAKKDASGREKGAPLPPAAIRPLLNFVRLPPAASRRVIEVLESDEPFRTHVAGSWSEDDLGRGSWLFLHRPDGWSEELDLLIAAAAEEDAEEAAGMLDRMAERRLAQAEEMVARLKGELAEALDASQAALEALAVERATSLEVQGEQGALQEQVQRLEQERQHAVRSMKEAEKRAAVRLEESRQAASRAESDGQRIAELEAQLSLAQSSAAEQVVADEPAVQSSQRASTSPWDGVDPTRIEVAVRQAALAAKLLGEQLAVVAQSVAPAVARLKNKEELALEPNDSAQHPDGVLEASRDTHSSDGDSGSSAHRPPRRTPLRLLRGVIDGSPEGVEQLLFTPQVILIADGYNISMEAWPQLDGSAQRSSLLNMLSALQARTSALVHVVFDGEGTGSRPAVGAPLAVRVHFSKAEVEADDLILEMVAGLPTDQPVVVVSSDRRVQDGARRLGANVVSSGQLLALTRNP